MPDTATADAPAAAEAEETKPTEAERIAAAEEAAEKRELARQEASEHGILVPARYGFDSAQVEAIRKTVAVDASPAELVMFLEVAARYELDPFAKQIFCAQIGGTVQIIVSRDGLLAHAHKQADFVRLMGDVVHKNDTFKVSYDPETGERRIQHEYGAWGERGEIEGAWAVVERKGKGTTFFFAPMSEYKGKNVWGKNPSAMILKVAESYALRKAYSISGVVGEEEIARKRTEVSALPEEPEWGDDDVLAERLQTLFNRANEVEPGSYRPQKVRTMLGGTDREEKEEIARNLEGFIERHLKAAAAEAEVVQDAEVVEDDEGKEEQS